MFCNTFPLNKNYFDISGTKENQEENIKTIG